MPRRSTGFRRLQEELRTFERRGVAARKRMRLPSSRREAARDANATYGASGLDARRIGEWLGDPGRAPRDPDQVWALVQVWAAWAGEGPGRQQRRYWNQLVEDAQPVPKGVDRADDSDTGGSAGGGRKHSTAGQNSDLLTQLQSLLDAREADRNDRRQWYPLENGLFPTLRDSAASRASFLARLQGSLVESFGDRPARFVLTLAVQPPCPAESSPPLYSVWSHQREFVVRAVRKHEVFLRKIIEARLNTTDVEAARRLLRQEIMENGHAMEGWQFEPKVVFDTFPRAHLVTYDPVFRRTQVSVDAIGNADPEEYDNKVTYTSEALTYACALGGQPLPFIGYLESYSGNLALVKLAAYLLERRELDFTRFRVLQDDPEVWDFRYPEVEAKIVGHY